MYKDTIIPSDQPSARFTFKSSLHFSDIVCKYETCDLTCYGSIRVYIVCNVFKFGCKIITKQINH